MTYAELQLTQVSIESFVATEDGYLRFLEG